MKRYYVQRCDDLGSLTDQDGNPIDHTWDVVDRVTGQSVRNTDRRKTAREVARELNQEVQP